jgi:hypothetical protein
MRPEWRAGVEQVGVPVEERLIGRQNVGDVDD